MEEEGRFTKLSFCMVVVVLFAAISYSTAGDTIYAGQIIGDGETIVSAQGTFELGFFSPCNSTNRYVGTWSINNSSRSCTCIPTLNRNAPLTNTSGEFSLTLQGSMVIRYANGHVIWSSGKLSRKKLVGQLLDNGEFRIREETADGLEKNPIPVCRISDFLWNTFVGV